MKNRSPRFLLPVLAAAGLMLALAGCGDISLLETLKGESPGELRFSPSTALVPEESEVTFAVLGGFTPYQVAVSAGLTPGTGNSWVFPKTDIDGESELFTLEATDSLGNKAIAEVTVYAVSSPLELNVLEVTLLVGQSWTFTATGGSGSPDEYSWTVDGVPKSTGSSCLYTADTVGIHTVEVTDSIGLSQAATVTVEPVVVGAPLAISPEEAVVEVNRSLSFTALGGSAPYSFEVLASGAGGTFAAAGANPATYTAPAAAGTDTIKLSDGDGNSVNATVKVIAASDLVLSPQNPILSGKGDTIQFQATGGTGSYKFSSSKPEEGRIDEDTGFYEQLGVKNVTVTVTDSLGATDETVVKVK